MAFILKQLQAAAADLNDVLKLDPPIVTVVEIKGRGAAKAKAEADFLAQLQKDIFDVAEGQDPATKIFDLRVDDIPVLKPETVEVIYSLPLSEATKARLSAPASGKGKAPASGKGKAPASGKGKAPGEKKVSARAVIFESAPQKTKEQLLKALKGKVEEKLIKMYLKAWEKGDRVPDGKKMSYTKEGIIQFKENK